MSVRRCSATATRLSDRRRVIRADDGVTVVEMLVSSFVLGLGVLGVASLLIAGARSASVAEVQRDATAIAVGELETIRSLDYDLIGIETSAEGYLPTDGGLPTVTEIAGNLIEPIGEVVVGGVTFEIERSITWASVGANPNAYKIAVIEVAWATSSGPRSITLQTGLHEGLSDG